MSTIETWEAELDAAFLAGKRFPEWCCRAEAVAQLQMKSPRRDKDAGESVTFGVCQIMTRHNGDWLGRRCQSRRSPARAKIFGPPAAPPTARERPMNKRPRERLAWNMKVRQPLATTCAMQCGS
jgi:hypothetical protein